MTEKTDAPEREAEAEKAEATETELRKAERLTKKLRDDRARLAWWEIAHRNKRFYCEN